MPSEIVLPPNVTDLTGKIDYSSDIYNVYACGSFADIFKGKYNGRTVAVKIMRIRNKDKLADYRRRFTREVNTWTILSSPDRIHVLEFIGIMNWDTNGPAIISSFQKNGTIMEYIAKNQQADRHGLVLGMAKGLQYIHGTGVAHGDLKSNNVLIDDSGAPLIADFGQSRLFDDEEYFTYTTRKQHEWYTAPEIFAAVDEDSNIDALSVTTKAADIYAFSITAFEVLSGKKYVPRSSHASLSVAEKRPKEGVIPERDYALLAQCWVTDPDKRLKIGDVVQKLEQMRQ